MDIGGLFFRSRQKTAILRDCFRSRISSQIDTFPPRALAIRAFSIILLLYSGSGLARHGYALVPPSWYPRPPRHDFQTAPEGLPEVVPHPGSRNRMFVDQNEENEERDQISRALGAQIPNPGSVSRRAGCEHFDVSPRIGAVGGDFATVSHKGSRIEFPRR
jgi:hypothetical protein